MYANIQVKTQPSQRLKSDNNRPAIHFSDNRPDFAAQRKTLEAIQRKPVMQMGPGGDFITLLLNLLGKGGQSFLSEEIAHRGMAVAGLSLLGALLFEGISVCLQDDELDSLAKKLGISRKLLLHRLKRGFLDQEGGLDEEAFGNYINQNEVNFASKYDLLNDSMQMVPKELIAGLSGKTDDQKVQLIFDRLNLLPFFYIGDKSMGSGFYTHVGDCSTLADMFKVATQAAGVQDVEVESDNYDRLINAAPIHGRNTQGNTEGELYWCFDNHYWCTYHKQVFDLLFMTKGPIPIHKALHKISIGPHTVIVYESGLYRCDNYITKGMSAMKMYLGEYAENDLTELVIHANQDEGKDQETDWAYVAD